MLTNEQQVLNLLGIARRAGELSSGEEIVLNLVRSQRAQLVLIASDAGRTTQKKFSDKCQFYNVPASFNFNRNELNQATGQKRTVYCVTQNGFAKKIQELLMM